MNGPERRHTRASFAALAVASLLALPGCAVGGALDPEPRSEARGVAHLQLSLPLELKVGEVAYEISGNDIAPIDGVMVASPAGKSLGAVVSLPSGHGYTLRVSTVAGANFALCQTSIMFDVDESKISEISVPLECDGASALDAGTGVSAGLHADAAADHSSLNAGLHGKDAATWAHDASADASSSHGDASMVMSAGKPLHDAGTSAASVAPAAGGAADPPPAAIAADAGAVGNPSAETCDSCRLLVCSSLGDARRVAGCYLAWGSASEAQPCKHPSECPTEPCNQVCAGHP